MFLRAGSRRRQVRDCSDLRSNLYLTCMQAYHHLIVTFLLGVTHAFVYPVFPPAVGQPSRVTSAGSPGIPREGHRIRMETKPAPGPSGLENLNKWDPSAQQAFIQPATHNKNPVRVAAILAASALAAKGSLLVPGNLAKFAHILAYAVWMGSTVWTTFVAGITMMRNLPRQTFGKLQSKLFPAYFQLNFAAISAIFIIRGCPLRTRAGATLLVSLATTLLNLVLLEPKSTSVMFQRYKLEDEKKKDTNEYKALGARFGLYHGLSSFANLGALIGSFVYAWELATMLP